MSEYGALHRTTIIHGQGYGIRRTKAEEALQEKVYKLEELEKTLDCSPS